MDFLAAPPASNLLPYEGEVWYYGPIMSGGQADSYLFALLHTIPWKNDEVLLFGRRITTQRKVAWYGDSSFTYAYSGTTKQALPWTRELWELKRLVEQQTGSAFNSCLLNLYQDGTQGMAWHSDDEKALGQNPTIASVSLGAERKFALKHKTSKQAVAVSLAHGSLLVMQGVTQHCWQHALPKSKKISQPRVNLTFRTIMG